MENFELLKIKLPLSSEEFEVNAFWLRDHCRCAKCYNESTKQKKYNLLNIPEDIRPVEINYTTNDEILDVKWSDEHKSNYDIKFLHNIQLSEFVVNAEKSFLCTEWDKECILQYEHHLRFSLTDLISKDGTVKKVLKSLVRFGIVFIDDVPPTTTMTEMAIRCLFPVMKTLFGEMYTFSDQADHADTAYTKEFIGLHTDNTYFCDAAGLQALHCIKHIGGTGGENFFVDGRFAAMKLKQKHPKAFEVLTKVHVPAEYIEDGEYHKHSAPIIRIDPVTGDFVQLRLNLYDRAAFNTLPQDQMRSFYDSLRTFLAIIDDMKNRWTLKLRPGTIVIFDNWRICHARHSYTGARTMTGAYVQRTDFLSKARIEGVID